MILLYGSLLWARPGTTAKTRLLVAGVVFLCVGLGAPAARADVTLAVQAYQRGYVSFSQKKYTEAIRLFRRARKLLPRLHRYDKTRVELDRLIGLSLYRLRKFRASYSLLDNYLRSPLRRKAKVPQVRKVWQKLRSRLGIGAATRRRPPPVRRRDAIPPRRDPPVVVRRTPPPEPQGWNPHPGAWAIASIGLVALGTAVVVGVVAQQNMNGVQERYERLRSEPDRNAQSITLGTTEALTQSTVANALYIGGGVLTATGAILLFTWNSSSAAPHSR